MKMFRQKTPKAKAPKAKTPKAKTGTENITLAAGLSLRMSEIEKKESRILTLLLKGFLVYLIVMGSIGCFLTSLDIQCVWWVIHLGVLLGAIYCSFLYYNKLWQNLGYILLLLLMLALGIWLHAYISSGFFAVANKLTERASIFFESNALRTYKEQIGRHQITIPIAMCYIGWVLSVLMNVLISRRMNYVAAALFCGGGLFMPLYLEREPSTLYIVMLAGGLIGSLVLRKNGHYRPSMQDRCYAYEPKKQRISYVHAGRTVAVLIAFILLFSFAAIRLVQTFYPEERYAQTRTASSMKAGTMDVMENITMLGIMGLFNYYPNTGGLTGGTLGGVNAVQRDFETDLTVTYTPYSFNRLYLKTFTGGTYLPVKNRWNRKLERRSATPTGEETTLNGYKSFFESGAKQSAKGRMRVTNVAAAYGAYAPYYSTDTSKTIGRGETVEYEYYPPVGNPSPLLSSEWDFEYYWIPEANREVIREFCREAELFSVPYGDVDAVVEKLTAYYQANIPYTLRPGATPYREDFINHFLTKNRRGYCAHFASAATLVFRYRGIPARYVEGYALDAIDIEEDGTVLSKEKVEDYYEGYAPLGESAVVSVDVTDASAHAWVEVYDKERGWHAVEVTPMSMESEDGGGGLWQRLLDFLISDAGEGDSQEAGSGEDSGGAAAGSERLAAAGRFLGVLLAVLALSAVLFFAGRRLVRKLVWHYRYRHAGNNDKLIMRYRLYIRRVMRRHGRNSRRHGRNSRRHGEALPEPINSGESISYGEPINYREQLAWLVSHEIWKPEEQEFEKAVRILEKAGFSAGQISEEDLKWMLTWM